MPELLSWDSEWVVMGSPLISWQKQLRNHCIFSFSTAECYQWKEYRGGPCTFCRGRSQAGSEGHGAGLCSPWHLLADRRGDRSLPLSLWATGSVPQSCLLWQYRLRAHHGWARVRGLVCWLSASPPPPGLLENIFVTGHRPLSLVNFRNTI